MLSERTSRKVVYPQGNCQVPPPDTTDLQFCGQESFSLLLVSYNLQSCNSSEAETRGDNSEKMHWTEHSVIFFFF